MLPSSGVGTSEVQGEKDNGQVVRDAVAVATYWQLDVVAYSWRDGVSVAGGRVSLVRAVAGTVVFKTSKGAGGSGDCLRRGSEENVFAGSKRLQETLSGGHHWWPA